MRSPGRESLEICTELSDTRDNFTAKLLTFSEHVWERGAEVEHQTSGGMAGSRPATT